MKKEMSKADYAERQKCEAEFQQWWVSERSDNRFIYIPAVAIIYIESEFRKAWLTAKGLNP